jgi:hypothetical protein
MRELLDRILRDATLVTLALALALGWTLVLTAQGVADTVSTLLTHYQQSDLLDVGSRPLTWVVGGRLLTLYNLLTGLIAFAVVLIVALLLRKRALREGS